jgi:rRNA processing protein Gar1
VEELGEYTHTVEGMALFKGTNVKIPILKRRVFLEDKNEIGKVDDVFGQIS